MGSSAARIGVHGLAARRRYPAPWSRQCHPRAISLVSSCRSDLGRRGISPVCTGNGNARRLRFGEGGVATKAVRHVYTQRCVQMTACGSFALDVPRRNLRSFCLVSSLKVYNLASEPYGKAISVGGIRVLRSPTMVAESMAG